MPIIGYLRLVRLPNVFTAMADIFTGFFIMRSISGPTDSANLWLTCGASAALYLSGMAFNDLFDRKEDARIRPHRPIPSGQVSISGAALCGILLMLLGIALAACVGKRSIFDALSLATFILSYNLLAKHNCFAGPVTLGCCRFFNVHLGMSGAIGANHFMICWAPPLVVGLFAAGLTAFSAQEEAGKQTRAIASGWILCGAGILLAGVMSPSAWLWLSLAPLVSILLFLTWRLKMLGTATAARNLVRAGVMGICLLDAGLILGFAGLGVWLLALSCAGLVLPGVFIAKWLAQKEA